MSEIHTLPFAQRRGISVKKELLPFRFYGPIDKRGAWNLDEIIPLGQSKDQSAIKVQSRVDYLKNGKGIGVDELPVIKPVWKVEAWGKLGGYGRVHKAWNNKLKMIQAVKVCDVEVSAPDVLSDQTLRTGYEKDDSLLFIKEAKTLARIRHPNVMTVYDLTITPAGKFAIILEWMDQKEYPTLKDIIKEGPMEITDIHQVLQDLGSASTYLRKKGILHRDLKPGNIFFSKTNDRHTVIGDFGLSNMAFAEIKSGRVIGTPEYLPLERLLNQRDFVMTEASDVYSMGVITYEMMTGKLPIDLHLPTELTWRLYSGPEFTLSDHPELLARIDQEGWDKQQVEQVFRKAFQKEPEFRYQTVAEFAEAFIAVTSPNKVKEPHHRVETIAIGIGKPPKTTKYRRLNPVPPWQRER